MEYGIGLFRTLSKLNLNFDYSHSQGSVATRFRWDGK